MAKKPKYEDLPILPTVVADAVCARPYTGSEWSKNVVSPKEVAKIEAKRLAMSPDEIREFGDACDFRCKAAYEVRANWFEKIVKKLDSDETANEGRDDLYKWVTHWMTSYLMTRKEFMRNCGQKEKGKRTVTIRIGKQTIAVEVPSKKLNIRIGGLIDENDIFINGVKYVPAYLGRS